MYLFYGNHIKVERIFSNELEELQSFKLQQENNDELKDN